MKPFEAFLNVFGDVKLSQMIIWGLGIFFIVKVGREISKWFDEKHRRDEERLKLEVEKDNRDKQRDEDIKTCLSQVAECVKETSKYPEYRQQSLKIQEQLTGEIQGLRTRIEEIENDNKMREQSKLRSTLLQLYRHYTNPQLNPTLSWTRLESETFWALAKEYEATGGNGLMHEEVFPAMRELIIIDEK